MKEIGLSLYGVSLALICMSAKEITIFVGKLHACVTRPWINAKTPVRYESSNAYVQVIPWTQLLVEYVGETEYWDSVLQCVVSYKILKGTKNESA